MTMLGITSTGDFDHLRKGRLRDFGARLLCKDRHLSERILTIPTNRRHLQVSASQGLARMSRGATYLRFF